MSEHPLPESSDFTPAGASPLAPTIPFDEFLKVDIRAGCVLEAEPFPEARIPAIKLTIDFGPLGVRRSSAQLTVFHTPEALVGRMVVAVVNVPPKRVAGFKSEALVLGFEATDAAGVHGVALLAPAMSVSETGEDGPAVAPGARLY